ncbi:beta-hexosaminidase subunit beta-like isoform X2 [Coccinella septempunctata]|nr:beta-hexosaminidase subunit beta-like isoform X2 [Coccinella septempunctata]
MDIPKLFLFAFLVLGISCGPLLPIEPTKGGVVPLPQNVRQTEEFFTVNPSLLQFKITGFTCSILDEALIRYWKLISNSHSSHILRRFSHRLETLWTERSLYLGRLDVLNVHLDEKCKDDDIPKLFMNESYRIEISATNKTLRATTVWGMLRALESFSQLIYEDEQTATLRLNSTHIDDYPRFPHRGLLLDTSRHFIPVKYILKTLDAMSYNKLNVFHWHIVDDQSFPFKSESYPALSDKGAYHPVEAVYQPDDVEQIIEYARKRGIRVMVEFDTPGHTLSWGRGISGILTKCVGISDEYGPMDPSVPKVFQFLSNFFEEISKVFPERYIHLGGDEVPFDCWQSNPNITKFMQTLNITGDYAALESYFIKKLIDIVTIKGLNPIVWEEVFDNGVKLSNSTIVHVWKDGYTNTMNKATKAGKPVLLSSCWYLDHLGGLKDWQNFYKCDPYDFPGTSAQKKLVLGGEACMWSEAVNKNNLISRVWPRASATAEKLWSSITDIDEPVVDSTQMDYMAKRLEEHTCRMNKRNIEAEPASGPSFCY